VSPRLKLLAFILVAAQAVCAQDVRIGVLGLFRTHQLIIKSSPGQALMVRAGGQSFVLERSSGQDAASVTLSDDGMVLHVGDQQIRAASIHAANRSGGVADFVLAISGKISRHYQGVLEIKTSGGVLVPIVTMDLETAVASIVQAEGTNGIPFEARKAQAVAAREGVAGSVTGLLLAGLLSDQLHDLGLGIALCGIAPIIAAVFLIPRLPESSGRTLDEVSPSEV